MEILDCFCGVGPWGGRDRLLPYRPEEILALLDYFGIRQALVYHNSPKFLGCASDANRQIADLARAQPRFLPAFLPELFPYQSPPTPDELRGRLRSAGARALWLRLPGASGRQARDSQTWLIGDWLRACCAARLPVFYHLENADPATVNQLCLEFPELRLVLTGVMYDADYFLYPLLRRHRQLRVCLGQMYVPSGNPELFLRHFPAERLLFGSGLPEFSPGGLIAHVQYADIAEADKARILGGNARELFAEAQP